MGRRDRQHRWVGVIRMRTKRGERLGKIGHKGQQQRFRHTDDDGYNVLYLRARFTEHREV